jgi:hypothetical protein
LVEDAAKFRPGYENVSEKKNDPTSECLANNIAQQRHLGNIADSGDIENFMQKYLVLAERVEQIEQSAEKDDGSWESVATFGSPAKRECVICMDCNRSNGAYQRLFCGGLAGITSVTCTYPLDTVRTHLSIQLASFETLKRKTGQSFFRRHTQLPRRVFFLQDE